MEEQFVIVVSNDKGRPRFRVYQNSGAAIDLTAMSPVASGGQITAQFPEPDGATFTLSLCEP